jgi:long-chain acyl-CoA synthetase
LHLLIPPATLYYKVMFLKDQHKTAMIHDDTLISYRELIDRVKALASVLDIRRGDRAALFFENSPLWVYAFYSVWLKKAINVPIDYSLKPQELAAILNDAEARVVLCTAKECMVVEQTLPLLKKTPRIVYVDELPLDKKYRVGSGDLELERQTLDLTAVIMYTSGTTGAAKGVMLSYQNLLASIEGVYRLRMLTEEDTIIALLPFYHIFPLQGSVLAALYVGATIVFIGSLKKEEIFRVLQKYTITLFLGVPRLYRLFHDGIMEKVRSNPLAYLLFLLARAVRNIHFSRRLFRKIHEAFGGHIHSYLVGGARLDPDMAKNLWALGFRLVEGYGTTETAPLIAFNPGHKIKLGSVGLPMHGTQVKIEDGEVVVKGKNVMKGYYKKPKETAAVIKNGWFHTGDLGYFDKDGYLYLTGRKDEMIVLSSGKNINPEEVEDKLKGLSPLIREVGVVAVQDRLMAVVYPNLELRAAENLHAFLQKIKTAIIDTYNRMTAEYKKIMKVFFTEEELPKTRLGKLRRFLLHTVLKDSKEHIMDQRADDSPEYVSLKRFIKRIKNQEISPDMHLELDLGLDSLDKVMLLGHIEKSFGIILSYQELMRYSTVQKLVEVLKTGPDNKRYKGRKSKTNLKRGAAAKQVQNGMHGIEWKHILTDTSVPFSQRRAFIFRAVPLASFILKYYFHFEYRGLEHLRQGPFIIAANHQSYLDVLMLAVSLPRSILYNTFFWVKASRYVSRITELLSGRRNIILLNKRRGLKQALTQTGSILRSGKNLAIFPEGIRTRDGNMLPFKKAFAIVSKELNVPIIPAHIDGAYQALPYKKAFPLRKKITLQYCKPIYPQHFTYQEIKEKVESILLGLEKNNA